MSVWRCAILIWGVAWVLTAGGDACHAQTISGRVLLSNADGVLQGDAPGAWVVICREKRLLKKQAALPAKSRFELSMEIDGRSFDIVVGAPDMTPTTLRGLAIESGQKLVLNVTVQRLSETLRSSAAGKKAVERSVADALDVLPPGSDEARLLRETLERVYRRQTVSVLVPAYFYPGGNTLKEWDEVFWAAGQLRNEADLIVVVNVQNGPGNPLQPDPNYVDLVARLSKAGATTVGYVYSDYGKRTATDVQLDVSAWVKSYPGLGGFLFDQLSSDKKDLAHYKGLCEFSRKSLPRARRATMIGNSGAICDEGYAEEGGFDMLCTAENKWDERNIEQPGWDSPNTRAKTGAILYGLTDRKDLATVFDRVTSQGLSFIYVTDQKGTGGDTLWTRMPDKNDVWRPLVQRVKDWNKAARSTK